MTTNNNNIYEQVYNVNEDENVTAGVAMVVCALLQRGLFVAGFNINKELLTVHYTGYGSNKPVWDLDFFEHMLSQEALLTVKEKVKGIFIATEKQLIVPADLYEENSAQQWLRHIHFVEAKDTIATFPLDEDKAHYLQAMPMHITELIKINFKKATVQPFALHHFNHSRQLSLYLQCTITNEQVFATLHNYSLLLWHQVFDYSAAEDIAYALKHVCIEKNISPNKVVLICNANSASEYAVIKELGQYFPNIKSGSGRTMTMNWEPAISLANQLFSCVL